MSWDLASLVPVQYSPIGQPFLEVSFSLLPQFPLPQAKGDPVPRTLTHCPCTATPGLALAQQLLHPQQCPAVRSAGSAGPGARRPGCPEATSLPPKHELVPPPARRHGFR